MAVPGSPLDPRAAGTNRLLRNGATLVRDADDVIEAVSNISQTGLRAPGQSHYDGNMDEDAPLPAAQIDTVRAALSPHPVSIDEIARTTGLGAARCAAILMELELAGEAVTLAGGLAHRAVI